MATRRLPVKSFRDLFGFLNLIRLHPIKQKGGIKNRRFIAAVSDHYCGQLRGLV